MHLRTQCLSLFVLCSLLRRNFPLLYILLYYYTLLQYREENTWLETDQNNFACLSVVSLHRKKAYVIKVT